MHYIANSRIDGQHIMHLTKNRLAPLQLPLPTVGGHQYPNLYLPEIWRHQSDCSIRERSHWNTYLHLHEAHYSPPFATGILFTHGQRNQGKNCVGWRIAGVSLHEARASGHSQGVSRREGCVCCTSNWVWKEPACALHNYVTKYHSLDIFLVKKSPESAQGAFLSHLDIVNVMADCWFTPGRVLLMFLCSRLCAYSGSWGSQGAHTCSLIVRCVVMPTTMLTWWWYKCQLLRNYSVLLASAVQQVFH